MIFHFDRYVPVLTGLMAVLWLTAPPAHAGQPGPWTLKASVQQALDVAPEIREASAEVAAREAMRRLAGAWPNPSLELRADQKLGLEDGRGGTDLTQIAVSQPLPLTRLARQRDQAGAQLAAARERLRLARLARETQAARAFHALQLAEARLTLAGQRVAYVADLGTAAPRPGTRVVRYLTPLERARLAVLREEAEQEAARAEGKHSEAAAQFRALLGLPPDAMPQTAPPVPADRPPALEMLLNRLDTHPALAASNLDLDAARAGIAVARASRFADPVIALFRETDYLGGSRRDYSGVLLSVQVPLWNLNAGGVARAEAETDQVQARRAALRRDLETRLRQGWLHLGHLIEQTERFRERLRVPARQVLEHARRGFDAGEQNVLALVDAYNTYFDAEVRYHELLHDAGQEAAELRYAAGETLVPAEAAP